MKERRDNLLTAQFKVELRICKVHNNYSKGKAIQSVQELFLVCFFDQQIYELLLTI